MKSKHLIARSDELDKKIEQHPGMDKNMEQLFAIGRRNHKLIKLLYASLILEVLLVVAVGYFANQALANKTRLETNHTALVTSCNTGNDFRKDTLALWNYILGIPLATPQTDAQKKTTAGLEGFIKNTFAMRDCTNIK